MYSYRISGTAFHSSVILPELVPGNHGTPEFTFQLCDGPPDFLTPQLWLNHWYSYDGSIWLSFAKIEDGYLLRFPDLADFIVSRDGRTISCILRQNCPYETMRHLLLNQVIPIVLSHLGKLVLHASACTTPRGVMAFMGMTGMGKSTLAASFGLRGFAVLSDDCLLVEERGNQVMSVPSYGGLRLWPESVSALFEEEPVLQPMAHYTDKKRVLFDGDLRGGSFSLKAVYGLTLPENDANGVTITPLTAREGLFEIVKHTFQLDVTDHERLGQAFKRYEWLAKSVPFFKLTYPRDHAVLPSVNAAILNHLDGLSDPTPQESDRVSVSRKKHAF
jgi:hypothetical protein